MRLKWRIPCDPRRSRHESAPGRQSKRSRTRRESRSNRVRWFEGPVLAERGYVAQQAQNASVRRQGDSTPGPRLGEVVAERLTELGADPEDAQWDSRKHGDGSWQVQLTFRAGGRLHIAEWLFDPRRRHVTPADDNAGRLSLPEAELPPPAGGSLGAATVTPIRRPDRREAAPQHHAVEEPVEEPARAAAHAASSPSFAPPRPPAGRPPETRSPAAQAQAAPQAQVQAGQAASSQSASSQPASGQAAFSRAAARTRDTAADPAGDPSAAREQDRPAAASASHATAPATSEPSASEPSASEPSASEPSPPPLNRPPLNRPPLNRPPLNRRPRRRREIRMPNGRLRETPARNEPPAPGPPPPERHPRRRRNQPPKSARTRFRSAGAARRRRDRAAGGRRSRRGTRSCWETRASRSRQRQQAGTNRPAASARRGQSGHDRPSLPRAAFRPHRIGHRKRSGFRIGLPVATGGQR